MRVGCVREGKRALERERAKGRVAEGGRVKLFRGRDGRSSIYGVGVWLVRKRACDCIGSQPAAGVVEGGSISEALAKAPAGHHGGGRQDGS